MKTYFFPSVKKSLIIFLALGFFACGEEISLLDEEVIDDVFELPDVMVVHTKDPHVSKDVTFKGELKSLGHADEVEYGFMWYDPNANEISITEVRVGYTTKLLDFEQVMTNLPDKPKLIVCSYARVHETEETVIGEEIEFDPSL